MHGGAPTRSIEGLTLAKDELVTTCETIHCQEGDVTELGQCDLDTQVFIRVSQVFRTELESHACLFLDENAKVRAILDSRNVELGLFIRLGLIDELVERHRLLEDA